MFKAPIPGMSLTGEPKKYPWERPPELASAEDVAEYYLDKFSEKESMDTILDYLAIGDLTLKELVEGILRLGVSKGLHTIDAGLLVAPVLHKTIKLVADAVEIEYDEGLVDKKEQEARAKDREFLFSKKLLSKIKPRTLTDPPDEAFDIAEEVAEEKPKGLVERRK